uniref:Uncharacterized protein n=1 Tax=uncultured alpha proteobacterium HF0130_06E21 TaxID=710808 RepID=E0XSY5_9PROT|nr:hypothetical protein [uncultured alpha proteobacterium HF0130_06E21]
MLTPFSPIFIYRKLASAGSDQTRPDIRRPILMEERTAMRLCS